MNTDNLEHYINDHLAGAGGALELLTELVERAGTQEDREFFQSLRSRVAKDEEILHELMQALGLKESHLAQAAGRLTMKVGRVKMMWDGIEPGSLGLFEALEMLVLGVAGKKLLWVALREISPHHSHLEKMDFESLLSEADSQKRELENKRLWSVPEAFLDKELHHED